MGICQAKEPRTKGTSRHSVADRNNAKATHKIADGANNAHSPRNYDQQSGAEQYLRSFLEGAEGVLNGGCPFNSVLEQHYVSLTFLNSCVEVTRTRFRLKMEVVVEIIAKIARESKLKIILKTLPDVKEFCVDDGFARILNSWFVNNTGVAKTLDGASERPVMDDKNQKNDDGGPSGFADILAKHLRSATLVPAMNVFPTFAEDGDMMSVEQFGKYVRETQGNEVTDTQLIEKYKYRFGGVIHRYNFNTYAGSLLTNNALDPSRTTNVWQDMTQPLTRYLINTTHIETEIDLKRAISDSSRAFVLSVIKNEKGELCSGSCPLKNILESIKKNGFLTNPYPIIICLSPKNRLSPELGDELASFFTMELGSLLAKGLMFEGAIISDPKFSPAAQRKKVLLLGYQSRLKPFVGSLMADMNRDGLGVRVTDVLDGTPAAKAGLARDDWLTHINGEAIQNKTHLRERLTKLHLGEEFTLKRENLEEIKVVVGGTVDTDDKSTSSELSKILFLKFTESDSPKPWETQVFTPKTIKESMQVKKQLDDHFAFLFSEGGASNVDYISIATQIGIQLIDSGNTRQFGTWAQGRFVDNGHCGYLIKNDIEEEGTVNATVDIIAGPQEIKGPSLTKGTARVYGAGSARVDGSKFIFKGCNDSTVAVIDCEFAQNGGSFGFTAAFPPVLLRTGYRVLPLEQTGGPKNLGIPTLGAFCFIRRDT